MNNIIKPEFVPSISDYKKAFLQIKPKITDKQKKLLINHCKMPSRVTMAQTFAESVGYKSYRGVNSQYGKLGMMVARAMKEDYGTSGVLMLFTCARPKDATNKDWLLVLRENVIHALEELEWVEKTSHLFDPAFGK